MIHLFKRYSLWFAFACISCTITVRSHSLCFHMRGFRLAASSPTSHQGDVKTEWVQHIADFDRYLKFRVKIWLVTTWRAVSNICWRRHMLIPADWVGVALPTKNLLENLTVDSYSIVVNEDDNAVIGIMPSVGKKAVQPTNSANSSSSKMMVSLFDRLSKAICSASTTHEKNDWSFPCWSNKTRPNPPTPPSRHASAHRWNTRPCSASKMIRFLKRSSWCTAPQQYENLRSHVPTASIAACVPPSLSKIWACAKPNLPLKTPISACKSPKPSKTQRQIPRTNNLGSESFKSLLRDHTSDIKICLMQLFSDFFLNCLTRAPCESENRHRKLDFRPK